MYMKVCLSSFGIVSFLAFMFYNFNATDIMYWYGGPYLIVNAWLVMYTYLQHTHENIPHFANKDYTFRMVHFQL